MLYGNMEDRLLELLEDNNRMFKKDIGSYRESRRLKIY